MGTKLIEVALPLDAINAAAAREKSIRHGHPSTLHLWWARRPLAACRAVLFASIVDDPSSPDYIWPAEPAGDLRKPALPRAHSEEEIETERTRLHDLISKLVLWESSTDEVILGKARAEILRATEGNPPPVLDPFCGGGSIPLEAQRLGLEAHGSDLNPVAVLITKALIEIPPKFANQPPVNPRDRESKEFWKSYKGAEGLAADVRYYGKWMRDEAEKRIGHLYPKVRLPKEQGGGEATVIAWLWARTVKCPNPACGAQMPLVSSFWLSKKKGKETWVEPVPNPAEKRVDFRIASGKGQPPEPPKLGRGAKFRCLVCGEAASERHIKDEGTAGRMGAQMLAIVAEGAHGRVYLPPSDEHECVAASAKPAWRPDQPMANDPRNIWCIPYGLTTFGDLFTPRQLDALTTFSDLVGEARERVRADAIAVGLPDDGQGIADGGTGATAYADAVATYLAFGVSKATSRNSTQATWETGMDRLAGGMSRQAIPMTWDFAESNPVAGAGGDIEGTIRSVSEVLDRLSWVRCDNEGDAIQQDARRRITLDQFMIATDPPYYDNIGYADLSDFFYVWLRRTIQPLHQGLFRTILVPKADELIASPYRHDGSRTQADRYFERGLSEVFASLRQAGCVKYPLTLFYAFKQSEQESGLTASTGWETMLEGLMETGFVITGTWPVRSELISALKKNVSALASSVVIVGRPRPETAPETTRTEFVRQLRRELPKALRTLQQSSIAPVDLAQAAIGPGMATYSRYKRVLEPSGEPLRVRTALQLINQVLDEVLAGQDAAHDRATGWAVAWFEQFGMAEAKYGQAETLATARAVSVQGLVEDGIVRAGRGKVRLLSRDEPPGDWDPTTDARLTDWEIAQQLIRALETNGQAAAGALKARIGGRADLAKDLAYRLYTVCERKGWAQEALAYNSLVVNWPQIEAQSAQVAPAERQGTLV